MSDNGDETIDAGPDALQAIREQAAKLRAERDQAKSQESSSTDPPLRVWRVDDTDAADRDHDDIDPTIDRVIDADGATAGYPDDLDDDDFDQQLTTGQRGPEDPTVPMEGRGMVRDGDGDGDHVVVEADESVNDPSPGAPVAEPSAAVAAAPAASVDSGAARDFVREARELAEAAARDQPPSKPKGRRSGAWVVLAVILGAQILAGGVYLALTALGNNDEQNPDTEEVATSPETTVLGDVAAGSTPVATPRAAPTPAGTPTPVPPTPTWLPVSDGPRSAPFTFVLEAIVNEPGFFEGRDGQPINGEIDGRQIPLVNPLASGEPLVVRVVGGEPGDAWAQVELPGDAAIAWVRTEEFVWDSTTLLVQIDLATNSLQVFDGNVAVYSASIASGTRGRPTPQLSTYITETLPLTDGQALGRIRLASFGERTALSDGLSALAIESTTDTEAFANEAGYSTDGRILLTPNDFTRLGRLISAGAKVEIVGVPAVPTPTPRPQIDGELTNGPEDGFFGCPPATRGSPPNCYRIVERLTVAGLCSGRQVPFDDDCYILGGNPELDAVGRNCPSSSPDEFGGLCYLKMGPVPQLPGPCPEGTADVANECREPA